MTTSLSVMAAAEEMSADAAAAAGSSELRFCMKRRTKNSAEGFTSSCLWHKFSRTQWHTAACHKTVRQAFVRFECDRQKVHALIFFQVFFLKAQRIPLISVLFLCALSKMDMWNKSGGFAQCFIQLVRLLLLLICKCSLIFTWFLNCLCMDDLCHQSFQAFMLSFKSFVIFNINIAD